MLRQQYLRCSTHTGPLHFYRYISAREWQPVHAFSTFGRRLSNPLFNLGGLSTSRESQYLSKERGIPRTEFAPHLELIRSSEVDTQRTPGSTKSKTLQPVKEKKDAYTTNELVTIPKEEYSRMERSVAGLKKRLEATEQSIYLNTEHNLYASERQLGRVVEEEQLPGQEGLQLQTVPPISETTEQVEQVDASSTSCIDPADDAKSRQPWTFSRLFWARKD
ncbi:MAG: hypothetical protein Q9179_000921 [Wetmoreana sp. 5 TL-2023]